MKHRLKKIRPPATPRVSVTITLTILAGFLAGLAALVGNLASTTIPKALKPYVSYSWPALGVILLLGIGVAIWQVWYASGQTANNAPVPASQSSFPSVGSSPSPAPLPQSASTPSASQVQTAAPTVSPASTSGSSFYHTCVISYSNKDAAFVNKLYTDLQAQGVPCLLVEQDLKIGDKLRAEIYRAIRQLDRLLLVLSHNAITSKWVEEAIDTALERESQQPGTYLLFPLRLDDAILSADLYWASAVRQRLIGDFTLWQKDAEYQQAFQRVLRDLHV